MKFKTTENSDSDSRATLFVESKIWGSKRKVPRRSLKPKEAARRVIGCYSRGSADVFTCTAANMVEVAHRYASSRMG
jgi:hypothetical protein